MDLHQAVKEIREAMFGLGVHLRQDWIKHCLQAGGGGRRQQSEAQEGVYRKFLACDLREAGEACLPAGIAGMVKHRVEGKMVVQVENATDIAKNFEQREKTDGASSHHTLKLALGDGRQTVAAFEYRRIQGLVADPPPGLKLLLVEPWVRRGILLLTSDNTTVLGGEDDQVASLVEAKDMARAGGGRSAAGRAANAADSTRQEQNVDEPRDGSGNGVNDNEGSRAPPAPKNASAAMPPIASGSSSRSNGRVRPRLPAPTPEDSSSSQARRRRRDESADPAGTVVDLSSRSSPSPDQQSNGDGGRRPHNQHQHQHLRQRQQRPITEGRGGRRDGSSEEGHAGAGTRGGVSNPYARVTQPAGPTPRPAAIDGVAGASRNERQGGQAGEAESKGSRRPPRGREARVPAFPDMDEDDGPGFEYLEEPEFQDNDEQPPDEVEQHDQHRGSGGHEGMRSDRPLVSPSPKSTSTAGEPSPSPPPPPPPPPVTPRPTIVSARVQRERQEQEQEARKRRRAATTVGRERGGGGACASGQVSDIEGEFGRGSEGEGGGGGGEGIRVPQRKRGCSGTGGTGGGSKGNQPGARGAQPVDLDGELASLISLPGGPYTSLEDLSRLSAVGGGVYRVKAVVSDARNCKIRKKKYLLVVEIEDGTAVASVRLCDQITRRLFGVDAREFKKLFQADPDLASDIQRRVEKEIREMEGVMEIDISAAASGSQQSPAACGTPSAAASQSSATGDSEWLLPVVMSVKPPTDGDCRELLARVRSSLSL